MAKQSKAKKWLAVQVDPLTKQSLGTLKEKFGESEAYHMRHAIAEYLSKKERAHGMRAASRYLIQKGAL